MSIIERVNPYEKLKIDYSFYFFDFELSAEIRGTIFFIWMFSIQLFILYFFFYFHSQCAIEYDCNV